MLQENAAKSDWESIEFIPDEEPKNKQNNDYETVDFVPDANQPNLFQADIKDNDADTFSIMGLWSDIIAADVQLQNRMERVQGEQISGAVSGAAGAVIGQPAEIVGTTFKIAGDVGDMPLIKDFGDEMLKHVNTFDQWLQKDWIEKNDEAIDPRISQISRIMANGGAQILPMQAASKYLGGALTYALYTVPDAGETYFEARESGKSKGEAALAGGAVAAGFFAIDRFVDGAKLIKGMGNTANGLLDVLLNGSKEASAEALQEAYKNLIAKIGYDNTRNLMSGVLESAIGGFTGGAVAQVSVSIGGVEYNPSARFNESKQVALSAGATEQDIGTAMSELYNIMDKDPQLATKYLSDIVNKNAGAVTNMIKEMPTSVAYQSVDDFYKTADEFIKQNEGTPEAKEAQKIKTELDEAYKDTYAALENLMPKEQAKANAKLVQGHALFASREFGISPKQYMEDMFAKVELGEYYVQNAPKPKKPKSLLQFLIQNGGIKDENGELKALDAQKGRPGLVNNKYGLTLDRAREIAEEAGYFGTQAKVNLGSTSVSDLLGLIDRELRGDRVFTEEDAIKQKEIDGRMSEEDARDEEEAYYERFLDDEMVDYSNMTFEEKKAAFKKLQPETEYVPPETESFEDDFIPFQESMDLAEEMANIDYYNEEYTGETINIDGVEKPVYNSNGDRIAKSEEALRAFYKWFGDSKVVDAQGNPVVVYHGTKDVFDTFLKEKGHKYDSGYAGDGFYFTNDEDVAKDYSDWKNGYGEPVTMPLYLKMDTPLVVDSKGSGIKTALQEMLGLYVDNSPFGITKEKSEQITKAAKEKGYDGIIALPYTGNGEKTFVAFDSNQIKSVDNQGTFDINNPNIYYQEKVSNKETSRRVAHRTESNLTPEEKEAFDRYFAEHPNKKRVKANLKRLAGTPYASHLMDQILSTQAIYDLMEGKDVNYETGLTERQIDAIKGNGIEGLQNWYTANSIITGNEKTGGASVNSSYMNCNPSELCAKFCYAATRGHLAMAASDNKASIIEILAEKAPTWLADAIAREYKVTAQYRSKLALRLFDKGDGDVAWLPVIKRLNENGVRVAIFSKRPNFIREVNKLKKNGVPFNLTMLSIDSSNVALADANKDLKIALVVSGKQDFDMVRKLKDRIQVLLPVHVGGKMTMPKADLEALKKEIPSLVTEKKICPISSNEKEKSAFILGTTELANPEKGWNCAHCDQTGCGCYFGSTTKQILEAIRGEVENGNLTLAKLGAKISTITKLIEELNNGQKITEEDYEGLGEGYTKAARLLVSDTGSVEETRRARGSELIRLTLLLRATMDDIQQQLGREADKTTDKGSGKQDESKRGRDKEVLSKPSGSERSSSVRGLSGIADRAEVLNKKVYFQSGYVSMRNPLVGTQLDADAHYGEGEHGNMAHGWGNYLLLDQAKNKERYYDRWNEPKRQTSYDGTPFDELFTKYGVPKAMKIAEVTNKATSMARWRYNSDIVTKEIIVTAREELIQKHEDLLSQLKIDLEQEKFYERGGWDNKVEDVEEAIKRQTEYVSGLKDVDPDKIKVEKIGGTAEQHEFDIPEKTFLLNENASLDDQPVLVEEALEELNKREGKAKGFLDSLRTYKPDSKITGFDIYDKLTKWSPETDFVKEARWASKQLESVGIKGIFYKGGIDGEGVVIFNKEDTKHIQRLLQEKKGSPRGAYYNGIIHLFKDADASTFVHESMHFYREELKRLKDKSARANSIINTLDTFSKNEFEKNYRVKANEMGYSVVDKNGRTVYNNQGNFFDTREEAEDYAREEIIARGFEKYVREGKSPSKHLAGAFRSFMKWLKHLYTTAKSLGVELNDDVRRAYGDLLGGQDLDYWMGKPAEEILTETQSVEQDRKAYLDDIIADAVANKLTIVSQGKGKGAKDIWTKMMIPLSTRAKRISPKLSNRLRMFEFNLANELNKKYDISKPFLDIWKKMSEEDAIAFDLALKNDYIEKQQAIISKYGSEEQWSAIKGLLAEIYSDATNVGIDLGYRKDYFPRKVKDVEGFLAYLHSQAEWTQYQQALKEADPSNVFTMEEKAEFLNKYLRGFVRVDLMPVKYGSEKTRKIPVINNELNRFYAESMESYISYIEGMNARIESAKFLGKDAENYEESIGGYLNYLLDQGMIAPNQIDDVREILQARFGQRGVHNRFLAAARDLSYIYTMGGVNSAITQLEDFSVSMYKAGVWNTLTTVFGDKPITKKDLGIENISQEFVDGSKTSQWLNKMFKLTGLDKIDSVGKETLVNAVMKKYKQIYDKNPQALRDYIEPIMEDKTNATINDILNGEKTDNVKFLLFNELSDVQPVSLSELPEFYNKSGNLRVLYMLKSFMVKRIDTFRNEAFDKIRSKDRDTRIQGMKNLLSMSVLMMLCGATKDWIIDLLYGRKTILPELLVNNLLGLFGITKFHLYKAREQGATGVVKEFAVPPLFSFFDDLIGDIYKLSDGKRKVKDMEVLKGIPLGGRFYYWWIGGGAEKQKKKKRK